MKKLLFVAVALSLSTGFAKIEKHEKRIPAQQDFSAKTIVARGVVICAAECNSEVLGHRGHDLAKVGTIYFADAKLDSVRENQLACLEEAKKIEIFSARSMDSNPVSCIDILKGKYRGKTVTIRTGNHAVKPARMTDDERVLYSIHVER